MGLLFTLAVIAACPIGIALLPRMRPVQILLAMIVTGVVVGSNFMSVGPVSIDRVLLGMGLAGIILQVTRGAIPLPRLHRLDIIVGLFTLWMLYSSTHGEPPADESPIIRWLIFIFLPSATYALARFSQFGEKEVKQFSWVVLTLGVYLAVTGVFEVFKINALVFPRYIMDPAHWEFLGRARGPLLNPMGNGIYLTTALAVAVFLWVQNKSEERTVYSVIGILLGIAVVLTLTRSVWIGALLLVPLTLYRYARYSLVPLGLFGAGAAILLVVIGPNIDLLAIKRDDNLTAADAANSVKLRPILAKVAANMFWDRPLTGHGYACYLEAAKPYVAERNQDLPLEIGRPYVQHNVFLAVLVDSGLIGLTLFLVILWFAWWTAWRLAKESDHRQLLGFASLACLGSYIVNGMFHDVGLITLTNTLLFLLSGIVVAATQESKGFVQLRGRRSSDQVALPTGDRRRAAAVAARV